MFGRLKQHEATNKQNILHDGICKDPVLTLLCDNSQTIKKTKHHTESAKTSQYGIVLYL